MLTLSSLSQSFIKLDGNYKTIDKNTDKTIARHKLWFKSMYN